MRKSNNREESECSKPDELSCPVPRDAAQEADKPARRRRRSGRKPRANAVAPAPFSLSAKELESPIAGARQSVLLDGLKIRGSLVICAEPDMGKSHVLHWIDRCARSEGWQTFLYSFDGGPCDKETRRIVRMAHAVGAKASADGRNMVLIDGVTSGDEYECACMARALERLRAAGCQIVLCIRPEMEQLAEALPTWTCYRTEDLLYRFDQHDGMYWNLTGGIAMLVRALVRDGHPKHEGDVGTYYVMALTSLIGHMIRPGLPSEDCALRLAAILLGSGTMQELAYVAGRCDFEQLAWFGREVALFDVDCARRSFCGHGISNIDVFSFCVASLQRHAAQYPRVVVRACEVLVGRGDVRRSAVVCTLCSAEFDLVRVGTNWGVSYVDAGEVDVVAEALRTAHSTGMPLTPEAQLSELAAYTVMGTAAQFDAACEQVNCLALTATVEQRACHDVRLLSTCRIAWRNPLQLVFDETVPADDHMGMRCLEHVRVMRLLVSGQFGEAYALMNNEMLMPPAQSIASALLHDDLRIALLLSGGLPDEREQQGLASAETFFSKAKATRLKIYHAAFVAVPQVLMGMSDDVSAVEDAAGKADRAGDAYLQAICLAVMAVADLRTRAWPRAHVRAAQAAHVARELEITYLASAAGLLDALSLEMMGESGPLGQWCAEPDHPNDLALLGMVMAQQAGELERGSVAHALPAGMSCPRNALWLLGLAAFDLQAFSRSVAEALPASWVDRVRTTRMFQMAPVDVPVDERDTVPATTSVDAGTSTDALDAGTQTQLPMRAVAEARVRISVLGGFRVEVDGTALPDSAFDRRHARDLVLLLALVPGHRLRRYQVIDILWPDVDYFRGPRKLYEATGEVRKQIGYRLGGLNAVLTDRSQGAVGFDVALVDADVDEFEREARLTLVEDHDDFWVLDHARRMDLIYGSGPDQHIVSLGGRVVDRVGELETLYVDACVAAGEAALRLGKTKLAVRYGTDAHRLRELREDAMILLVEALRAAGRGFEVPSLYRTFAQRLIEEEGVAPSLALQHAVSRISDEGPEALSA